MIAIALNLTPAIRLNPDRFKQLCHANPDAKLELTHTGELVVMSPTGGETGNRNIVPAERLQTTFARSPRSPIVPLLPLQLTDVLQKICISFEPLPS